MKTQIRIIDGKRYNKATATRVASYSNGHSMNDFHYVCEELYRTSRGAWFLFGEGGALSKYSQPCGNNASCGGDKWSAFSVDEAFEWLESHHETEALEQYFADRIEEA